MAIHQALLASVRLETFPKSTVDIFITVIEADGMENCVAAGSVAASTALADAGIEIFGLVMSCSAVSSLHPHTDILTVSRLLSKMRFGSTQHQQSPSWQLEPWWCPVCPPWASSRISGKMGDFCPHKFFQYVSFLSFFLSDIIPVHRGLRKPL